MRRYLPAIFFLIVALLSAFGQTERVVVLDADTRVPLSNASIFNKKGVFIGICRKDGSLPPIPKSDYPLTIRYLGYIEKTIDSNHDGTVFLHTTPYTLHDVVVESREHKVLHILAYVREYSTMTDYNDTIFLFREKMVDYMFSNDNKRLKGWSTPRVLATKSYYRFTNAEGLDSVSDRCNHHFSWTDWAAIPPSAELPDVLKNVENGVDTLRGKYSPVEIWNKDIYRINLDVNVLAGAPSRKWVPNFSVFFDKDVDFEQFRLRFNYDNDGTGYISPSRLMGYSFNIDSNGRGRSMFRFNKRDTPFYVSTYGEVYIIDKEYIQTKEARKWTNLKHISDIDIIESPDAPDLQPEILALISRVNHIEHDRVRLDIPIDQRIGYEPPKRNFATRALNYVKNVLGISDARAAYKWKKSWIKTRKELIRKNNSGSNGIK